MISPQQRVLHFERKSKSESPLKEGKKEIEKERELDENAKTAKNRK